MGTSSVGENQSPLEVHLPNYLRSWSSIQIVLQNERTLLQQELVNYWLGLSSNVHFLFPSSCVLIHWVLILNQGNPLVNKKTPLSLITQLLPRIRTLKSEYVHIS